jgi:hypothetical protein
MVPSLVIELDKAISQLLRPLEYMFSDPQFLTPTDAVSYLMEKVKQDLSDMAKQTMDIFFLELKNRNPADGQSVIAFWRAKKAKIL